MSLRALLTEMLAVVRAETEAVKRGDHQAVMAGVERHEALLAQLEKAENDMSPAEVRGLVDEIERERTKLRSLLERQSAQVEFLLKLMVGGGGKSTGYPGTGWATEPQSHRLNRRT